jgi:hypothetical protein
MDMSNLSSPSNDVGEAITQGLVRHVVPPRNEPERRTFAIKWLCLPEDARQPTRRSGRTLRAGILQVHSHTPTGKIDRNIALQVINQDAQVLPLKFRAIAQRGAPGQFADERLFY